MPATEAAVTPDRKSKMFVSPVDDGPDEELGSKEEGGLGAGMDGRGDGQVFEMSADQEVREMDGGRAGA